MRADTRRLASLFVHLEPHDIGHVQSQAASLECEAQGHLRRDVRRRVVRGELNLEASGRVGHEGRVALATNELHLGLGTFGRTDVPDEIVVIHVDHLVDKAGGAVQFPLKVKTDEPGSHAGSPFFALDGRYTARAVVGTGVDAAAKVCGRKGVRLDEQAPELGAIRVRGVAQAWDEDLLGEHVLVGVTGRVARGERHGSVRRPTGGREAVNMIDEAELDDTGGEHGLRVDRHGTRKSSDAGEGRGDRDWKSQDQTEALHVEYKKAKDIERGPRTR